MRRLFTHRQGFTIVELLIVIVVIGILAAITIIAFNGVTGRAAVAAIQADLANGNKTLERFRVGTSTSETYPLAIDCTATPAANTICIKGSGGNSVIYQVNNTSNPASYCLMVSNGTISYKTSNTLSNPTQGNCTGVLANGTSCPTGFIAVPGNSSFGTSDFCAMKYEAKQSSATVPISQATGAPWASITQTNAITYSANVAGCTGCHLMTESERLTLAHNVLNVSSNWSSGTVGTGYIYSGHNDSTPGASLVATTDDSDGYNGTGNVATSSQRRTLTLSNGEVIWDFAGNVNEWTTGTLNSGQQPGLAGDSGFNWKEWNNGSLLMNALPATARPAYGTSAASGWTSTYGIGQLYSNYADTSTRGFIRGGAWNDTTSAGVFALYTNNLPSGTFTTVGFRVTK